MPRNLLRTSSPVLVGRSEELQVLVSTVPRRSTVVMIEGEAGIGKTRLVDELLAHPKLAQLKVLVGHCQHLREPFPYGAVIEALRSLAGTKLHTISPVAGALRPLLPELADVLPPQPEPIGDPHAERHRTLRATREVLAAIGPAVLVVEDLQWADDGTRQLLRFLMADPPTNLSVVITYRREDLAGHLPLGTAYRPPDHVAGILLQLRPLDVDAVRVLAASILEHEPVSAEFADRLHERTAGIPFVVEELLRSLHGTAGRLPDEVEVPVLLRDAFADRLAGLPDLAHRVVHAAAVLGVPAGVEQLSVVAGIDAEQAELALIQLARAGVLHETRPNQYGFRHVLAQQAVYDSLEGPARRQLHLSAIDALRGAEPPPLVQLAEHSRRAGRRTDWLRYGEDAADRATEVGDPAVATGLLQRLLAEPDLPTSEVDRLATKLGSVAYAGLDQHDPVATLDRVLSDQRLSTAARGEVRLLLGRLMVRQSGRIAEARMTIRQAIDELTERPDLAARAAALLGTTYIGDTPVAEQLPWLERVEQYVGVCDSLEIRLSLLANVLGSRLAIGDPAVLSAVSALPTAVESQAERRQLARARCNLSDSCTTTGHFDKAREFLTSGVRLAAEAGSPFVVSTARSTEVRLDWYTGRWAGLAERATRLLGEYRDLLPVASELSLVLGFLAIARGEWPAAAEHLGQTGVHSPQDSMTPIAIGGFAGLARMWLAQDDLPAASAIVERGLQLVRHKGIWIWAADLAPIAVSTFIATGRPHEAAALIEEFADGIAGRDAPLAHAALSFCRGELSEDPEPHFRAAETAYRALDATYLAAQAAERAGTQDLPALADWYDVLGATRDAARCRHDLRSRGTPAQSRRGRRGYGLELSPREQDVARLVSQGLTNREIAEVLFLSPRTVEQHVAKVLRKLGAVSRAELGRATG
ncbi:LuxR family transcriptional regulator [Kribbella antibiotica]|uniref:LuxR family transcriptional regulator n=1 Tax=Kribbella antibiotica TaxID=190195 RepID=A0A4R4ZLX4_9ACTN|nr:LuxR family transcriptional regulator [Kribbella antibiotica]TDD58649.1 LuxR family transcriptional regulator [Kribbella antibiotica]